MGMGIHGEWQTRNDSLTIRECHSPHGKGNDHRWCSGYEGVSKTSFENFGGKVCQTTSCDNIFFVSCTGHTSLSESFQRRSKFLPAVQTSIFQEPTLGPAGCQFQFQFFTLNLQNSDKTKSRGVLVMEKIGDWKELEILVQNQSF